MHMIIYVLKKNVQARIYKHMYCKIGCIFIGDSTQHTYQNDYW